MCHVFALADVMSLSHGSGGSSTPSALSIPSKEKDLSSLKKDALGWSTPHPSDPSHRPHTYGFSDVHRELSSHGAFLPNCPMTVWELQRDLIVLSGSYRVAMTELGVGRSRCILELLAKEVATRCRTDSAVSCPDPLRADPPVAIALVHGMVCPKCPRIVKTACTGDGFNRRPDAVLLWHELSNHLHNLVLRDTNLLVNESAISEYPEALNVINDAAGVCSTINVLGYAQWPSLD